MHSQHTHTYCTYLNSRSSTSHNIVSAGLLFHLYFLQPSFLRDAVSIWEPSVMCWIICSLLSYWLKWEHGNLVIMGFTQQIVTNKSENKTACIILNFLMQYKLPKGKRVQNDKTQWDAQTWEIGKALFSSPPMNILHVECLVNMTNSFDSIMNRTFRLYTIVELLQAGAWNCSEKQLLTDIPGKMMSLGSQRSEWTTEQLLLLTYLINLSFSTRLWFWPLQFWPYLDRNSDLIANPFFNLPLFDVIAI